MNGRTTTLGGVLGATLLTIAALSTTSCEESDNNGDGGTGFFGDLARQCGLTCPASGKGVAYGNSSVTGYAAVDSFFRSVVNYNNVATGVSAEINAELDGIQALFRISDAERRAQADLGAAIRAKLQSTYMASVVVNAQPAKCSVDAHIAAEATAKCHAEANCEVREGRASFNCMGTCTVEASVEGTCAAEAQMRCTVTGPSVSCMGECSGTCYLELATATSCSGNCVGTCSAACNGDTDPGAGCNGQCAGMCQGRCELAATANAQCMGKCSGSCEYNAPTGGCEANAEVSCDLDAQASASCTGSCSGEFEPPTATCDASASCQASAKAEARFQVQCTPPSVEVKVVAQGGAMAQAEVDFLVAQLKLRLPRLSAVTARARLATDAADELRVSGSAAVESSISAIASAELDFATRTKVATCTVPQLQESRVVIMNATSTLQTSVDNADSVARAFSMVM